MERGGGGGPGIGREAGKLFESVYERKEEMVSEV